MIRCSPRAISRFEAQGEGLDIFRWSFHVLCYCGKQKFESILFWCLHLRIAIPKKHMVATVLSEKSFSLKSINSSNISFQQTHNYLRYTGPELNKILFQQNN